MGAQDPQASLLFLTWSHLGTGSWLSFPCTDWRGKEAVPWTHLREVPHPHPPHGSAWLAAGLACCWGDCLKARIFTAGSRGQMSRLWGQDWLQSCPEKTGLGQAMRESRSRPGPDARLWGTPANTLHGPVSQNTHPCLSITTLRALHFPPSLSPRAI